MLVFSVYINVNVLLLIHIGNLAALNEISSDL